MSFHATDLVSMRNVLPPFARPLYTERDAVVMLFLWLAIRVQ